MYSELRELVFTQHLSFAKEKQLDQPPLTLLIYSKVGDAKVNSRLLIG